MTTTMALSGLASSRRQAPPRRKRKCFSSAIAARCSHSLAKPTADWFSSLSESYYLLGFSHFENFTFEAPLAPQTPPHRQRFMWSTSTRSLTESETGPGKAVMEDESARARYNQKRGWQTIHKAICTTFKSACGNRLVTRWDK